MTINQYNAAITLGAALKENAEVLYDIDSYIQSDGEYCDFKKLLERAEKMLPDLSAAFLREMQRRLQYREQELLAQIEKL